MNMIGIQVENVADSVVVRLTDVGGDGVQLELPAHSAYSLGEILRSAGLVGGEWVHDAVAGEITVLGTAA